MFMDIGESLEINSVCLFDILRSRTRSNSVHCPSIHLVFTSNQYIRSRAVGDCKVH
jgi:hypothetical protein